MALCLKYFYCFGVCLLVVLPGIVSGEIDAVYTFLSRRIDEVLIKTEFLKVSVENIDARVKKVEDKIQLEGLQTTTPNPIELRIEDQRRDLETEIKDSLEMQALAVQKMLSKEKLLLRASMENFTVVFAGLKSEILAQMSVFNASFKEKVTTIGTEFDNLKSEIRLEMMVYNQNLSEEISDFKETFEININEMHEIRKNNTMVLNKGIAELTSDWNSTTHNISQILQTMEGNMVSNIEDIEKRMIADVKREQNETIKSISDLQAYVYSLSTNISTFTSVLSNRISSESSSLSSNISLLSSSLSSQMSSHSNRIYLLEERIDECTSNPCMNNATCVDGLNSYSCSCLPGYNGTNCEIGIDECTSNMCMNNATCVDGLNSYSCSCLPGYNGTNCEIDIDECSSAPCKNGATCEDKVNGYTCSCPINWRGTQCDQTSHYGTDFYIGLFPQSKKYYRDIFIDVASQEDGTAVLSVPYLNINHNVTITMGANTLRVNETIIKSGSFIETRGIHIQTDVPVALYVTFRGIKSQTETYLALPVTALGTSYKVASYHPVNDDYPAYYSVFGMRENTNVTTYFQNKTTSFTLQPFSVGQHDSHTDLSNTYIQSDKVIAVISGTSCAEIPRNIKKCYYIVEQMVPTRHWVKHFIVPPVFPKHAFVLKILTIHNETVCIKNTTHTICNVSSILPDVGIMMGTNPVVVTSAAPISVVQYGVGRNYDRVRGGPFMTVIPGIGNYLNEYNFVAPSVWIYRISYLSVIVPSSQAQELYLDGSSLTVIEQYNVPDPFSNYTVIIAKITAGYHRLWHKDSNVLFGATLYGNYRLSGYGFPVGFSFTNNIISRNEHPILVS